MNAHKNTPPFFGTVTFDVVSWTVLGERLPSGFLPGAFQSTWSQAPAGKRSAAAKAATSSLREKGVLTQSDQVDQRLREALARFGLPLLRVGVRGWTADRTALSEIAVGPGYGTCLTRLLHIDDRPETGRVVQGTGLGIEVAIFPPEELLSRVWRVVPEAIRHAQPAAELPAENISMNWPEGLGLVESLARAHRRTSYSEVAPAGTSSCPGGRRKSPDPAQGPVADKNTWDNLPAVLIDVGAGAQAVFQATFTVHQSRPNRGAQPVAGQSRRIRVPRETWHGTWMAAGSRLVALRAQDEAPFPDRRVSVSFPSSRDHFPDRERPPGRRTRIRAKRSAAAPEDHVIRFLNTDGTQVYTDLALGVSGALGRQQRAWAGSLAEVETPPSSAASPRSGVVPSDREKASVRPGQDDEGSDDGS